jgi:hypothetical protein
MLKQVGLRCVAGLSFLYINIGIPIIIGTAFTIRNW